MTFSPAYKNKNKDSLRASRRWDENDYAKTSYDNQSLNCNASLKLLTYSEIHFFKYNNGLSLFPLLNLLLASTRKNESTGKATFGWKQQSWSMVMIFKENSVKTLD